VVGAAVEGKSAVYSHFYGLESASLAYTGRDCTKQTIAS
jgi:hypothetical protein